MKRFFNKPNPIQTFKEFVQQVFIYKYLVGDSYIYAPTLPGTQNLWDICENFWVLPSQLVSIDSGYNNQLFTPKRDQNPIKSYNIHSSGGYLQCDPRLIMHYRDNFCLELNQNYFYGRSRLLAQKYPISNLCAVYEARNIIYTKRGALGAIVNEKKDADTFIPLTDPEKKEIRNEFNSTYGITNRKDPVAVIDVPVKYIPFGMSIQDLQPFDEALADASSIAGAYNIDSVLIPRKDQSTFNNLKEAEVKVYTSVIIPDVKEFCEKLSEFLGLNAFGYYIDCTWDHVEVLQDARIKREGATRSITERCKTEFNAGLITLNEWRSALSKERITNPLFDKTLLEMSDQEIQEVKAKIG